MIKSFNHKGLKLYFIQDSKRLLNVKDLSKIDRILDRLDSAVKAEDMNIPGWDFHELKGNRKGTFSVAVRNNWKITFQFENNDAYHVDLEDYH